MTDTEDLIPLSQEQIEAINAVNEPKVSEPRKLSLSALKCKKCRQMIVSTKDFVNHDQGKGQSAFAYKKRDSPFSPIICSSYFIEPMDWIFDRVQGELDGKIKCPTCQVKLGNFSWAGTQCSCGSWITPSFAIHRDKVDEVLT